MANRNPIDIRKTVHWTEEEVKYLIKNYPKMDNILIANNLNRTVSSIRCKALMLNLKKSAYYWNKKDEKFLKENYQYMDYNELSDKLKRSKWSIINKYRELMGFR